MSANGTWNEETTEARIKLEELEARHREHRADLREHDGKIGTLQQQVARVDERVKFLARAYWIGVSAVVGALVSGFAAVLVRLHR